MPIWRTFDGLGAVHVGHICSPTARTWGNIMVSANTAVATFVGGVHYLGKNKTKIVQQTTMTVGHSTHFEPVKTAGRLTMSGRPYSVHVRSTGRSPGLDPKPYTVNPARACIPCRRVRSRLGIVAAEQLSGKPAAECSAVPTDPVVGTTAPDPGTYISVHPSSPYLRRYVRYVDP